MVPRTRPCCVVAMGLVLVCAGSVVVGGSGSLHPHQPQRYDQVSCSDHLYLRCMSLPGRCQAPRGRSSGSLFQAIGWKRSSEFAKRTNLGFEYQIWSAIAAAIGWNEHHVSASNEFQRVLVSSLTKSEVVGLPEDVSCICSLPFIDTVGESMVSPPANC